MRLQLSTFNPTFHRMAPLAPEYLRAAVEADPILAPEVEVRVRDYPTGLIPVSGVHGPGLVYLLSELEAFAPDVIGLSCYMWNIHESLLYCDAVRAVMPGVFIILGGQEVSRDWAIEVMHRHPSIDLVVQGEGEDTLVEVLRVLRAGKLPRAVPGTVWRCDGRPVAAPPRAPIRPLDRLPSPWLCRPPFDRVALGDVHRSVALLETYRGCPQHCAYCQWGESPVRLFSIERIEAELDVLSDHGIETVLLVDAMLGPGRRRMEAFLGLLERRRYPMDFSVALDLNFVELSEALVRRMVDLRVRVGNVGLQTTNPRALQLAHRRWKRERFERNFELLAHHYPVTVDLIAGLPGDSLDNVRAGVEYALETLCARGVNLFHLYVLPGSMVHEQAPTRHKLRFVPQTPHVFLGHEDLSFDDVRRTQALRFGLQLYNYPWLRPLCTALAVDEGAGPTKVVEAFGEFLFGLPRAWLYRYLILTETLTSAAINWRDDPVVKAELDELTIQAIDGFLHARFASDDKATLRRRALDFAGFARQAAASLRAPASHPAPVSRAIFPTCCLGTAPSVRLYRTEFALSQTILGARRLGEVQEQPEVLLTAKVVTANGSDRLVTAVVPTVLASIIERVSTEPAPPAYVVARYTSATEMRDVLEALYDAHAAGLLHALVTPDRVPAASTAAALLASGGR